VHGPVRQPLRKTTEEHSVSSLADAPPRKYDYRKSARAAIADLGNDARFSVPLGVIGPFSQWLGWPDWLREGTSIPGCGKLPQRISMADDITITANFLERGHGPELIRKTLQTNRLITGPTASIIIRNAPTLEQALIHLTSLIEATNMNVSLQFASTVRRAEVNVVQKLPLGPMLDFVAAIRLILVMRTIEWFLLADLQPVGLTLSLPHDQSIEGLFREKGVEVEMGADHNRISFPSEWRETSNSDYDASLWYTALLRLKKADEIKGNRELAARLRGQVATSLASQGKVLRLKEIAVREGVTVRTLARRLSATGIKFQELVDQERRQFVDGLISDASLTLADVACMSGFSNSSSFGRAFQQWHGESPGAYRDALNRH